MKSDENILKRLDAPTKAPAWPVGSEGNCHRQQNGLMYLISQILDSNRIPYILHLPLASIL